MRLASLLLVLWLTGCAGGDQLRIKDARNAYLERDFIKAEASLYTAEVLKRNDSRLQHFLMLSSIAFSNGQYEKAIYFLNKSREVSNGVRSDHGTFSWFDKAYGGNPIEYSYLHQYLVLAYTLLADEGKTSAWETPEIRDDKGVIQVQAGKFPARSFTPREIADLRMKARAELLAWDTHLENLKRSYGHGDYYQEDAWARILASYLHARSSQVSEKKTAQILLGQALRVLEKEQTRIKGLNHASESIRSLTGGLQQQLSENASEGTLVVVQGGVIQPYRAQNTYIGLSTLFQGIEDPFLRAQLEDIGFRVLMHYAPEFGLVAFTGAMAGAISSDAEDAPRHLTDAADRGFGFLISFPSLPLPPRDLRLTLELRSSDGQVHEAPLALVAPLHDLLYTELKARRDKEFAGKALRIGLQYLAILIPAIKAYQSADGEGAGLKKLAILAGYFIAKRAIDAANAPDLRSWSLLPQVLASAHLAGLKGEFELKLKAESPQGRIEQNYGKRILPTGASGLLFLDLGKLP